MNKLYATVGYTKQGYWQGQNRSNRYQEEIKLLIELIKQVRENHPRMNCRSMYFKINPHFVGRDKFESICREHGFIVQKIKNYKRTTDSAGVERFDNLLHDFNVTKPDQAWSSDITYFEMNNTFYYLTFIIDNGSRRILGHNVSSRINTESTSLPSLKMAIKTRGGEVKKGIIFHSDGGGQYYDKGFLALTNQHKFKNSMCKEAWENGKAERVNGIIKNNYLIPWDPKTVKELTSQLDKAVHFYNTDKPHSKLKRLTPLEYERKFIKLDLENNSTTKKSIDEKSSLKRHRAPFKLQKTILEL